MSTINQNTNIKNCVLEIHTDPGINYTDFNNQFIPINISNDIPRWNLYNNTGVLDEPEKMDNYSISNIKNYNTDEETNYSFGILKIEMEETSIIEKPTFIKFTVDCSGSMDELCKDKNTKMYHLKKTLINIIEYISTLENVNVYIQVDLFDDKINTIIEYIKIEKNNYLSLIEIIKNIKSNGSTNIGAALEHAKKVILKKLEENPLIRPYHIFLTDGFPTIGIDKISLLMEFICYNYANIMIGVGTEHNSKMLQRFASNSRSEYRFIDNGENAGLVYGEVLQKILRPAVEEIELTINNGEFYDWKQDKWVNKLYEDVIDSESTKIYHFRTKEPYNNEVKINGIVSNSSITDNQLLCVVESVPDLLDYDTNKMYYTDLSKYIYRQKTLELLSRCKEYQKDRYTNEANMLLELLSSFFKNMRKYMKKNELLNDSFMITLCEDITIAFKTLGSSDSQMFCGARQISQGSQYAYAPSYNDEYDNNKPIIRNNMLMRSVNIPNFNINDEYDDNEPIVFNDMLMRSVNISNFNINNEINNDETEDEDNIKNYILSKKRDESNLPNFTYSTPGKTQMMRSISKK